MDVHRIRFFGHEIPALIANQTDPKKFAVVVKQAEEKFAEFVGSRERLLPLANKRIKEVIGELGWVDEK